MGKNIGVRQSLLSQKDPNKKQPHCLPDKCSPKADIFVTFFPSPGLRALSLEVEQQWMTRY